MSIIKKFKVTSPNTQEVEFTVSMIRETVITERFEVRVDDQGNHLSQRDVPEVRVHEIVNEGIEKAVALPSGQEAVPEILETEPEVRTYTKNGLPNSPMNVTGNVENVVNKEAINLTESLDPHDGKAKPIYLSQSETLWADKD